MVPSRTRSSTPSCPALLENKPSHSQPQVRHPKYLSPKPAGHVPQAQPAPYAALLLPPDPTPAAFPTTHAARSSHTRSNQAPAVYAVPHLERPKGREPCHPLSGTPTAQPSSHPR